jgi:diaminopimelate epimerase
VAAIAEGLARRSVTVSMDGGDVRIDYDEHTGQISMTGDATIVYEGEMED